MVLALQNIILFIYFVFSFCFARLSNCMGFYILINAESLKPYVLTSALHK